MSGDEGGEDTWVRGFDIGEGSDLMCVVVDEGLGRGWRSRKERLLGGLVVVVGLENRELGGAGLAVGRRRPRMELPSGCDFPAGVGDGGLWVCLGVGGMVEPRAVGRSRSSESSSSVSGSGTGLLLLLTTFFLDEGDRDSPLRSGAAKPAAARVWLTTPCSPMSPLSLRGLTVMKRCSCVPCQGSSSFGASKSLALLSSPCGLAASGFFE